MEYTPTTISGIEERHHGDIRSLAGPALVRELRVNDFFITGDSLLLRIHELDVPLVIRQDHRMQFGDETVTAIEYFTRVLERNDLIDVVALPSQDAAIPIDLFWIHIVYVGAPRDAGIFSRKEDGLFAMRAKAGEKAERVVATKLRDDYGHSFDECVFQKAGHFEIRYDKTKRKRRPDLECLRCRLTFEAKKRNRDERFRVSHSEGRPFSSENSQLGWHAFIFPDMKPHFLSNAAIATAIANGNFTPGADRYDSWADVHGDQIMEMQPPRCTDREET